jgi:pimeloyl-ACP methyl ester carboxylesterase
MAVRTTYAPTPDGAHLAYRVIGDGPATVLLVPAVMSRFEHLFDDPPAVGIVGRLTSALRLIAYDRRGTRLPRQVLAEGRAGAEAVLGRNSDDIRAVLDHAGIQRAVLVAWSWGGPTAIRFAATHAGRTAGLVLLSRLAEVAGVAEALCLPDVHAELARVVAPTLVVHGGDDPLVDADHSLDTYGDNALPPSGEEPTGDLHELAGPGHLSPAEQAGVAGLVVDFARRLWPERPERPAQPERRRAAPTVVSPAREAGT